MSRRFKASQVRLIAALIAALFALLPGWKKLTGLFTWFSPFIMLNSLFVLKSFVLLNLLGIVVLVISFFRKRWFCRYLCPTGFLCDLASGVNKKKRLKISAVPPFGKWIAVISLASAIAGLPLFILLDPMAIFNGFFSIFREGISTAVIISLSALPLLMILSFFLPGIWCVKICPLGGLQEWMAELRNRVYGKADAGKGNNALKYKGRRVFIASGAGLLAGLITPRFLSASTVKYIRPPSSLPKMLFNTLCVRCGSCIKACPGNILIHHKDPGDPLSWMTPEVTFENNGYCIEECNLCSVVCPGGAITQFRADAKKYIFMATAEVNLDNCLLMERVECDRCKMVCSYSAITIEFNREDLISSPVIDKNKCVGCGACAVICPPRTIEMIPV